ncbi:MAG TPA: HPr family phosphocarrier protein [Verrucomicrobiales bacterium]|jgi:phosphocarrier protein|nr:HPr family phosphocarrier protein [Verrucomicrobiales bacterium]
MVSKELTIINKLGLHARPAAMFVKVSSAWDAEVTVEKDDEQVNGKSIMGLMMLAAGCGARITVTAEGKDEVAVLEKLEALVAGGFTEGAATK